MTTRGFRISEGGNRCSLNHVRSFHQPFSSRPLAFGNPSSVEAGGYHPWRLAIPDSNWSVPNHFKVGKSSIGTAVVQVFQATNTAIYPRMVAVTQIPEIIVGFQKIGFPNCAGTINRTHIPILCPPKGASEFLNRKCYYLLVRQGLVNQRDWFMNTGHTGKVHDISMLRRGEESFIPLK